MNEQIAILSAGSWGATLAALLARKDHQVSLWEYNPQVATVLTATRRLKTLPDLELPAEVQVTSSLSDALAGKRVIVSAAPSHVVRSTMKAVRDSHALESDAVVVSVSKGLEEGTLSRMSEVIQSELKMPLERIAVLSGPSHAEEVCKRMPTAAVVAGEDAALVAQIQTLFSDEFFRVYAHSDMIGVELGGTLKNVFAIACGISDGLGFGDNTRAALLTRGLNEMTRIGVRKGAHLLTFFGLTGMGDLFVTCMSQHSRNRSLGEKIGRGMTTAQALAEMTMVAEGYRTAPSAHRLAQALKLDCPLTREIYEVLYEGKSPRMSLQDLLRRETQSEWQGLPEGPHHEQSKTR